MKKLEMKKLAGVSVLSLGLVMGMAGFAGASSVSHSGPDSHNEVTHDSRVDLDVRNDNDLGLTNTSSQGAVSGDSLVRYNTTGGGAMTGDASNASAVAAEIEFDNSQAAVELGSFVDVGSQDAGMGDIDHSGPDSRNVIEFDSRTDIDVRNDNDVSIDNNVSQSASSGDATVRYNTTGGDAVSGSVSNTSSSSFTVRVTN